MLYKNLQEIERLSRNWLRVVEEAEQEKKLREVIDSSSTYINKTPHDYNGVLFTEEGVKTIANGREKVELKTELPNQTVRFNLRKARYEIEIYTSKPGQLDVTVDGTQAIRARDVRGKSILDLTGGVMEFSCTSMIQNVQVSRYISRQKGSIIIGPIDVPPGFTSASVVGEGTWDTTVASDYLTWGSVTITKNGPQLNETRPLYHKAAAADSLQPEPIEQPDRWIPYSVASRFGDYPKPSFYNEIPTGRVLTDHKQHEETSLPIEADIWWDRIGEWQMLLGQNSPGFYALRMPWTCVWGKASGVEYAVDLITGSPASATSEGQYLIAASSPEEITIDGVYAASYAYHEGKGRPKGKYATAKKMELPKKVYIRAEGRGLIRAFEIKSRQKWGPAGKESIQTDRIDLARYQTAGSEQTHNIIQDGELLAPLT